jgi:hypothetical protein
MREYEAAVELHEQGKTEELEEKPVPVPLYPLWTDLGANTGLPRPLYSS